MKPSERDMMVVDERVGGEKKEGTSSSGQFEERVDSCVGSGVTITQYFGYNKSTPLTQEFTAPSPDSPRSLLSESSYVITPADLLKLTSRLVQDFKDEAIGMEKSGRTISFTVPASVFPNEHCFSLDYEDMLDWCFQRQKRIISLVDFNDAPE